MAQIDFSQHKVHVKLAVYGPGLSGKITKLELDVAGGLTTKFQLDTVPGQVY
jgi:hypothetical protein